MSRSHLALVHHWDREAPLYDQKMSSIERRLFPDSRSWVCGRARGDTLEVGIGTGANLDHYPAEASLTGIDWSPAMLDLARQRAEDTDRHVALHRTDAAALPFPDASFDTVAATFALCCIPDLCGALDEAMRVLRPGGRLLLADHVAASRWPLRLLQHGADLISIPLHGEHFTRRPLTMVRELAPIVETERRKWGMIEHVHATKADHTDSQER